MTDGTFGTTYNTGTVTLTNGSPTAVFTGTLLSTVAEVGDFLYLPTLNLVLYVSAVVDDTHLTIPSWGGTTQTGIAYTLLKMSPLRYDPAITQAKTRDLLTFYEAIGFFYFVSGTSPDPSIGIDGQWALKTNVTPWQVWLHTGGVWAAQSPAAVGINPKGAWNSATAYVIGDSVSLAGSSYVALAPSTNHTPPNATYWQVIANKGDAATIAVGTVTTGAGGSAAAVSNSGTSGAAIFDFTIPQGKGYGGTSTTSLTIGLGSQAFTTQSGLAYTNGARVRASAQSDATKWMEGLVTYSGTALTMTADKVNGSGTFAAWNFNPTGQPGAGDLSSANNLSDLANKATARVNLGVSPMIPISGRVSTVTGVAVSESDATNISNLFLVPSGGNTTVIFDGSDFVPRSFAEIPLILTSGANLANSMYDIFEYWDSTSGTLRIGTGPAWSSDLARGTGAGTTEIETFNGYGVNKNAIILNNNGVASSSIPARQARHRGSFRTDTAAQTSDSKAARLLSNVDNPIIKPIWKPLTPGATWNYSTDAFQVSGGGSPTNAFRVVHAVGGRTIDIEARGVTTTTATGIRAYMGIGIDAIVDSAQFVKMALILNVSDIAFSNATYSGYVSIGHHTIYGLERVTSNAGTQTWYGGGAGFSAGIGGRTLT